MQLHARDSLSGCRRIVVTGSECTGKTTLSQQIATHLGALWLPEYARVYAESVKRTLTSADVEPIARGQVDMEDAALASRPDVTCLDTDLLSTVVYARHYYGSCPDWIVAATRARLASLYLLCDIDLPWEADGIRDQPEARAVVHTAFRQALDEFGAPTCLVSGIGPARLTAALACISNFGLSR